MVGAGEVAGGGRGTETDGPGRGDEGRGDPGPGNADADAQGLAVAARAARTRAHAPYSRFAVGAALRAADGRIFRGANMENAASPEGICAETAALDRKSVV